MPQSQIAHSKVPLSRRTPSHGTVCFPLQLSIPDRVSLVVQALALDQSNLHLGPRSFEIEREGDAGDAACGHRTGPAVELATMEQELAVSLRQVVGPGPRAVGRDVRAHQIRL